MFIGILTGIFSGMYLNYRYLQKFWKENEPRLYDTDKLSGENTESEKNNSFVNQSGKKIK